MASIYPVKVLARRTPAFGEKLTLSLDNRALLSTRQAHLFLPILEKMNEVEGRDALAYPPIIGYSKWRSQVIHQMKSSLSSRVWQLMPSLSPILVERSLRSCLVPNTEVSSWPADVLAKAEVRVEVERTSNSIYLRFSSPVGPLPHLLAGCVLFSSAGDSAGPYVPTARGVLTGRQGALRGVPSMSVLEFRPKNSEADIVFGGELNSERQIKSAPFSDVVVLLQSKKEFKKDRFGFRNPSQYASFRKALGLQQLIEVFAAGRGAPTLELLPAGLVPSRELKELPQKAVALPLQLVPLDDDAPSIPILVDGNDSLLAGTLERLRVMARSQGVLLRRHRSLREQEGWSLIRWTPCSSDPAVALLELASKNNFLDLNQKNKKLLRQLLDENLDIRLQATLELEQEWLREGRVIPLFTAQRWFSLKKNLKGVQVRDDGALIVSESYWSEQP